MEQRIYSCEQGTGVALTGYFEKANEDFAALIPSATMKDRTLFAAVMLLLVCGFDGTAYGQKTIYLTFDMDMNEVMYERTLTSGEKWYDPDLFAYLAHNNVAATFFVSGLFALAYPGLIENLASNPAFSFQNHSYDEASFTPHCYRLRTLTTARQKIDQIERTEEIIKNYTGQRATYFRFPGICTSAQEDALVESLGYKIEDGTIVASDPFNENTQGIVNAVLAKAKNEATVIMHVGGANAPKSLAALEQIVPQLRAQGYQFATLKDQSQPGEAMRSDLPQTPTRRKRAAPSSSLWRRLEARQQLAYIRDAGLPRRYSINSARARQRSRENRRWRELFEREVPGGDPLWRGRFTKPILMGGDDDQRRHGRAVSAPPKRARGRPVYARVVH